MLTIRKGNMAVFTEALEKQSGERLARYVLERFPHVFGEDAGAAREVAERASAAAATYGVTAIEDVATFADLWVMYGESFHEDQWASEVLSSASRGPHEKMLELQDRVFESGALM